MLRTVRIICREIDDPAERELIWSKICNNREGQVKCGKVGNDLFVVAPMDVSLTFELNNNSILDEKIEKVSTNDSSVNIYRNRNLFSK